MKPSDQINGKPSWTASIVMPLLMQRDEWLERALSSAMNQSVECEVIVITSPETPSSNLDLLTRFGARHQNLRIQCQGENQNFAGAINCGIRLASTERLGLLFCDDWLQPTAVERCVACDTDIVSTGATIFDMDGSTLLEKRKVTEAEFMARPTLERKAAYLSHFYLFRREVLLEIGGVDEDIGLSGADDFDMIWTLLERGASVSLIEDSMYCFRDHSDTRLTLRSREDQTRDISRVFRKHGVPESELDQLVSSHAEWFGERIQDVLQRRKTSASE